MAEESKATKYTLAKEHELRIEVDYDKEIFIKLKQGSAEVFGTALDLGEKVRISGQKIAVFTWEGCTLEIEGQPTIIYESDETPMAHYINVHDTLDAQRKAAKANAGEGPRIFVVGPTDSGKSTLCKILLNYSVRSSHNPLFADLDIGQGSITVPGCIAATVVEAPIDLQEGLPIDAPLVYSYGHLTPSDNPQLYKHLIERLTHVVNLRAAQDPAARAAGVVINSMGWVEDLGYEMLKHSAKTLGATVVAVVGDERLYSQLKNDLGGDGVDVLKLPKSGGVVTRPKELRQVARKSRVEEYFHGSCKELSAYVQNAKIEDLQIYRVGGGFKAPSTALPIGATSVADPLKISKVTNLRDLLYTLVAVTYAPSPDLLLSVNVAGFIFIKDVDLTKGTVQYLTPSEGKLPGEYLLAGNFKTYME